MNKEQFDKLASSLYDRGYKKYNQEWNHADYIVCKGFHKYNNIWEENRYAYQIILSVYDYTLHKEWSYRLPESRKNYVGIEIHVDVSRTVHEIAELILSWDDNTTIEKIEAIAESFYKWVCSTYPEPPKN